MWLGNMPEAFLVRGVRTAFGRYGGVLADARILGAVRDEAIFLYESGIASVEAIDTACRTALGYPMGPFGLMDLTGIDIGYYTKRARFAESGNPRDAPSKSVIELAALGHLGRKTGRGWYVYDGNGRSIAPGPNQPLPTPWATRDNT